MHARALFALALGALTLPVFGLAQQTGAKAPEPEPTHFKLVYRLLQIGEDGKIANARSYSTIVTADDPHARESKIRTRDRVPIATGPSAGGVAQFQYYDLGAGIDTSDPTMHGRQLALHVSATADSVLKPVQIGAVQEAVIRNLSWESNVVVTLDKSTIIFTSDNVSDTGKTELELTATEIKQP